MKDSKETKKKRKKKRKNKSHWWQRNYTATSCYTTLGYSLSPALTFFKFQSQIWNRTQPRALMHNQHTRELICAKIYIHTGESYYRRLRSFLLSLWYVFRALINSLVCWHSSHSLAQNTSVTSSDFVHRTFCTFHGVGQKKDFIKYWKLCSTKHCRD